MKRLLILLILLGHFRQSDAQTNSILHHGTFKKRKFGMSSNSYKPDAWEKSYFDSATRTAFPSDLIKYPEKYKGKLIHLLGIVDSVYIIPNDSTNNITFLLDNKYWDYIEDYSIQDEVMFVSEKGDGKFLVTITNTNADELESLRKFPEEKKLFLVYGNFKDTKDSYPVIAAQQIKFIDYEWYTTKVFSYEIKRDKNGDVEADKRGKSQVTNFDFLRIAKAGQNK